MSTKKMTTSGKYTGRWVLITLSLLLITLNLWIIGKEEFDPFSQPELYISQIFALWGLILISLSLILSTRIGVVENLFGGLDKSYQAHRTIGSMGFILSINHPLLLAVKALPSLQTSLIYLIPGDLLPYNLGIFGLYTMIAAFVFIAFIRLPYHIWLWTHKILGISFILAGTHALTIGSDIEQNVYLKSWMLIFIVAGIQSFIYTVLFYKRFGPRHIYKVDKIERVLDVTSVYMKPVNKKMNFLPGQFCYFSFQNKTVGKELHPFSLSSSPDDPALRISSKALGDFTLRLRELSVGDVVAVYGPYGKFYESYLQSRGNRVVWIAGGIGITPFLSMLRCEATNPTGKELVLYYSVKNSEEALFDREIRSESGEITNFKYTLWDTSKSSYLTAEKIKSDLGSIKDTVFQLCGPPGMMGAISKQLARINVNKSNIVYESFEML